MADHLPREFLDELRKKATPAHVAQYVTREMPPDTQWRPFDHLMLVNEKIVEACTSPEQTFLNIAISVRHGKSELISRYLPVWYLGMYPDRQVVIVSYNESKAAEWGAFARDVFKQYGPELFGLTVDTETSSKTEWKIKGRRGGMRSVGVNGSLTGIGADLCMASGTLVSTPIGQVEIDTLAREGGTVWAYDFASKSARPARITGATESSAPRLVQVTFTSGRVLRCTPEHPVYSLQRGWIGAGDLTAQDEVPLLGDAPMRSVRGRSDASRVRVGQVGQGGAEGVLLEEVRERGAPQAVRRLRGADRGTAPSVLSALCVSSQERVEAQACGQDVPGVLDAVPPSVEPDAVLLSGLRGCRPLKADDRHRELALQGRVELLQGLQGGAASGPPTGRPEVRRVWRHATPSGPPSGRGRDEQPAGEPHHPVQRGPHEAPQVSRDTVALVEHLPGTGHTVYDIEVEGLHNFFAGDLLVHNCIIDDPIKNREEADSVTARANMFSWYGSTLRTRLMPHGTMILTMARWHSDDLTGMIERAQAENEGGDPWEKINLPALAEPPKDAPEDWRDILGRAPGEALWPEVWPKEKLLQIKASILGSDWDSLYQQNPTPAEGGMFKVDAWRYASGRPAGLRLCRAWDLAATQDGGDWTVGALVGMTSDNRVFVCDIVRAQLDSAGVKRLVLDTAKLDGRLVPIRIEQERAGAGKSQVADYKRLLIGYDVRGRKPEGSKEQRAAPYASQQQESNVYLVDADRWGPAFVEEHRRFPKGRHDDQIDATASAFDELAQVAPVVITAHEDVSDVQFDRLMQAGFGRSHEFVIPTG